MPSTSVLAPQDANKNIFQLSPFNATSLLFMKYIINSHYVLLECLPFDSSNVPKKERRSQHPAVCLDEPQFGQVFGQT